MIFIRDVLRKLLVCLIAPALLSACNEEEQQAPSIARAQALLAQGDAVGAEVMLQKLIEGGTPRKDVAAYMGAAQLRQGDLDEAERWLAKGEFSKASAGYGYRMLGWLETRRNNLPQAGRAYDNAYRYTPNDPELWVDIGRLRYRGGEQVQAVQASQKAIELGADNPSALEFRAQLIRDSQGPLAAITWFEQAIASNPGNTALLAEYAATLGEMGRAKDMLTVVRRISELEPRNPKAMYLQAVLAARAGNDLLAQRLLQLTDANHRNMPAGKLLGGIIELRGGNYASAAQTFDQLASSQPDNRTVQHLLAQSLSLSGSHRELVHRFGDRAIGPSGSPYLAMAVGRSLEVLDQRDEAARYLDYAAQPKMARIAPLKPAIPLDVAVKLNLAEGRNAVSVVRGQIAANNTSGAVSQAQALRSRYPGSADALSLAGDAWNAAGNSAQALALYEQSARVRRPWPLAQRMYQTYRAVGKDNPAELMMSAELSGNPSNTEAALMLAQLAYEYKKYPIAAELLDKAIANGGDRDALVLNLRAKTALRMGDAKRANDTARQAYELLPASVEATTTYADVLAWLKPGSAAAAELRRKASAMAQ